MPRYKGNVFRGRFGYILRDITCVGGAQQCEKHCEFPDKCLYSKCFETPVPANSPMLRGQPFAPHPFVLEPPDTRQLEYAPGDTFTCNLILIGNAIEVLPWMIFTFYRMAEQRIGLRNQRGRCRLEKVESLPAFYRMAEQRIGLRNQRGRCRLEKVESLPARESEPSQTIFTSETEMLTDEGIILGLEDVMHAAPDITDMLDLTFLTPTSIKVNGKWTSRLIFETLIRNLLRRIRFLNYFHCGEDLDPEVDVHTLIEAARAVEHTSHLQWLRRDRYSHRAEASVPMDGFIGNIRFEGELTPFLPFIFLGEHLHIGIILPSDTGSIV